MSTVTLTVGDGGTLPARAEEKSFGYDLAISEAFVIAAHATKVAPTALRLAADLPINTSDHEQYFIYPPGTRQPAMSGVAMLITPRSSLTLKHGLIIPNAPGLVDASYAGEIGIILHNLTEATVSLPAGTRLAQMVFVQVVLPYLVQVPTGDPTRTRGGFGSTGL